MPRQSNQAKNQAINKVRLFGKNIKQLCADIFNKLVHVHLVKCVPLPMGSVKSVIWTIRCPPTSQDQKLSALFTVTTKLKSAKTSKITVTVNFRLIAVLLTGRLSLELWLTQCHQFLPLWCFSIRTTRSCQATTQLIFKRIKASLFKKFQSKIPPVSIKTKQIPPSLTSITQIKLELTSTITNWHSRCPRTNEERLKRSWPEGQGGVLFRVHSTETSLFKER